MAAVSSSVKKGGVDFRVARDPAVERVAKQRLFPSLCQEEGLKYVFHHIQPEDFEHETVIVHGAQAIRRMRCEKTKESCLVAHNIETESETWVKSASNIKFKNSDAGVVLLHDNNIDLQILDHQTGIIKETVRLRSPTRGIQDLYITGQLTCYYITQDGVIVIGTIEGNKLTEKAKKRIGYYHCDQLQGFGNQFILRDPRDSLHTIFSPDGSFYKIDLYKDLKLHKGRVYTVKQEGAALMFNVFSLDAFTAAKGRLPEKGVGVHEEGIYWGTVSIVAVSDEGQALYISTIVANKCSYFFLDLERGEITPIPGNNSGLVQSQGKALFISKDDRNVLTARIWAKHLSENVGIIQPHSKPFHLDSNDVVHIQKLDYSQIK